MRRHLAHASHKFCDPCKVFKPRFHTRFDRMASSSITSDSKEVKRVLNVRVISDAICPWCFVGKYRFEQALQKLDTTKVDVQIQWKPYMLDANLPTPGVDKQAHYKKKFPPSMMERALGGVSEAGTSLGLNIKHKGKVGNTLNSHRLSEWARKFGKQTEVVDAMFRAYFEENKDISELDTLLAAAAKAGLDKAEAKKFLESSEGKAEVLAEIEEAADQGVSGVPFFIIDNKYAFSGAQEPDFILGVFKKAGVYP